MKIRPVIDVPDGDECGGCIYSYNEHADIYSCLIFDTYPEDGKKLPQCVKDSALIEPYGWVVEINGIFDLMEPDKKTVEAWVERFRRRDDDVRLFPVYRQSDHVVDDAAEAIARAEGIG